MPRKAQIANRAGWGAYLKRNWELYLFVVPALIYLLLYCYYPMYGVQIAFKNFRVTKGITGSEWVGLEHFRKFFSNPSCRALIKNTLVISLYSLVVGFPLPIIFIICCIFSNCASMRFTSATLVPLPLATRFLRDAFRQPGLARS